MQTSPAGCRPGSLGSRRIALALLAAFFAIAAPGSPRRLEPGPTAVTAPPELAPAPIDRFRNLRRAAPELDGKVLSLALTASECAQRAQVAPDARYLAVIDYSLPSTRHRFWLLDLDAQRLLAREMVAHGVNTGENEAVRFSNVEGSRQTSLGLFRTGETYRGRNGYSLRLDGLEPGVNHLARPRAIVMHGAPYVSPTFAREHGRLGRSWGCPALDQAIARKVIDRIKEGHLLFAYYPDQEWLGASAFLHCGDSGAGGSPSLADRSGS
jgi:hypothetical protein